jgi:hypothetical protein
MNYKMLRYITGLLLLAEGALMVFPLITMLLFGEFKMLYAVLIPMAALFILGALMAFRKPADKTLGVKDGFVVVGLSWIILSLFGCLPFVLSGLIPNFIDAYFETVSGFTTTGASVLSATDFNSLVVTTAPSRYRTSAEGNEAELPQPSEHIKSIMHNTNRNAFFKSAPPFIEYRFVSTMKSKREMFHFSIKLYNSP